MKASTAPNQRIAIEFKKGETVKKELLWDGSFNTGSGAYPRWIRFRVVTAGTTFILEQHKYDALGGDAWAYLDPWERGGVLADGMLFQLLRVVIDHFRLRPDVTVVNTVAEPPPEPAHYINIDEGRTEGSGTFQTMSVRDREGDTANEMLNRCGF